MSRDACATCRNGAACRLVAAILSRYGFSFCTNRRGQCYFCGTALWQGQCVHCRLGRPELAAPLDNLGDAVWVGYYGTDEAGDMLDDELAPSLVDFLERLRPAPRSAVPGSAEAPGRSPHGGRRRASAKSILPFSMLA